MVTKETFEKPCQIQRKKGEKPPTQTSAASQTFGEQRLEEKEKEK